jgi:hypothetical protein
MSRQFRPSDSARPTNSKVVGVSINRDGNLTKVRVQFKVTPKNNVPIYSEPISINPIEIAWEKLSATL